MKWGVWNEYGKCECDRKVNVWKVVVGEGVKVKVNGSGG